MRTMLAILVMAAAAAAGDSREDIDRKLETKVSLDLRKVRLSDALDELRDATGLNFVAIDGADQAVSLTVKDVTAKSALRLLLAPVDLGATVENGAVVIRSRQSLAGNVILKVYDVRAAMAKVREFPGAQVGWGGPNGCICLCIHEDEEQGISPEFLIALIKAHTGARTWGENSRVQLTYREGLLYVTQTARIHRDIQALLARLQF